MLGFLEKRASRACQFMTGMRERCWFIVLHGRLIAQEPQTQATHAVRVRARAIVQVAYDIPSRSTALALGAKAVVLDRGMAIPASLTASRKLGMELPIAWRDRRTDSTVALKRNGNHMSFVHTSSVSRLCWQYLQCHRETARGLSLLANPFSIRTPCNERCDLGQT